MNDEQIAEHSNRIFVEHERLKREAADLRDELAQAQAERDHLRRALEWAAVRDRVGVRTALAATEEAQP